MSSFTDHCTEKKENKFQVKVREESYPLIKNIKTCLARQLQNDCVIVFNNI